MRRSLIIAEQEFCEAKWVQQLHEEKLHEEKMYEEKRKGWSSQERKR